MRQTLMVMKAEFYRSVRTSMVKFSILIIVLFSLFFVLAVPKQDDSKVMLKQENIALQASIGKTADQIRISKSSDSKIVQWKVNQAYLDSDKQQETSSIKIGYIDHFLSIRGLGLLLVVFPILFGGSIAREFEQGSIIYGLTSPIRRSKLFIGKYLNTIVWSLLYLGFALLINSILSFIFLKSGSGISYVLENGKIVSESAWMVVGNNILLSLPYYLIYSTIAFSLGVLTRSVLITLSSTLMVALLGTQLSAFIPENIGITHWFLPAILELTHYNNSPSFVELHHYSLVLCLVIILAYAIFFISLSGYKFIISDI